MKAELLVRLLDPEEGLNEMLERLRSSFRLSRGEKAYALAYSIMMSVSAGLTVFVMAGVEGDAAHFRGGALGQRDVLELIVVFPGACVERNHEGHEEHEEPRRSNMILLQRRPELLEDRRIQRRESALFSFLRALRVLRGCG